MANEVLTALDPLGKIVYLLPGMCAGNNADDEIYDDAATVIEKPAIMVEVKENNETQFYYFRSIGWHNTLLIMVHSVNNRWEVHQCIKNPSSQELSAILKKGKQIV
jgi:hypothetical protein